MTPADNKSCVTLREEVIREVARNLVNLNVSVDIIKKACGISYYEIYEIRKELEDLETAMKIARNLLEHGVSADIVQEATGLSDQEIDEIQRVFAFEKTYFK